MEFYLLARLAADPGVALSRETLMSDVWEHWSGSTKALDVQVAALRRPPDDIAVAHGRSICLPQAIGSNRDDNDLWARPGGMLDLGETVTQAAVREVAEETGIECAITGLVGVYSDPRACHPLRRRQRSAAGVSVLVAARALGGTPTPSSESPEVAWASLTEARCLVTDPAIRRPAEALADRGRRPAPSLRLPYEGF